MLPSTFTPTTKRGQTCPFCHKYIYGIYNMNSHQKICLQLHKPCSTCNRKFKNNKQYHNHLRKCNQLPFTCSTCKQTYTRIDTFQKHKETHISMKTLPSCPTCHVKFLNSAQVTLHIKQQHS